MTMPRTLQEIIDHANELASQFEQQEPDPDDRRDPEPMHAMRRAATHRSTAEAEVAEAVEAARAARYSWAAIGAVLGTSGEAARQRYGQPAHT
jgi:hypothetical protein